MSLARLHSHTLNGIKPVAVSVEVHISSGLPALAIVGMPETAVRESKDRVRAAILNAGFEFPMRRITISLAPADLPKEGGRFDLPIALGILAASGQIPGDALDQYEFHGELGLSGELRGVSGALPIALGCVTGKLTLVMPTECAAEAALVEDADVLQASHLLEVCHFLHQQGQLQRPLPVSPSTHHSGHVDLADVRGQHRARRALEVAAAGRHNMLMVGPPGTGKTMLASRLPGLLPPLTIAQAIDTASIHSISHQGFKLKDWKLRPFRAPHHTASGVALVGGGSNPRPGEISLAHNGVLFLDELTEFSRHTLDVLREPLETGLISISRAARQAEFPARFQLIAAMNPCPQGYHCDGKALCRCTQEQQLKHRSKISAPLLDRIDLHIEVPAVNRQALMQHDEAVESSDTVRRRVLSAWDIQLTRCGKNNSDLTSRETETYCSLAAAESRLLDQALQRLGLSARAYHRILRLARTIADLAGSQSIEVEHLTEAISYRSLDRFKQQSFVTPAC